MAKLATRDKSFHQEQQVYKKSRKAETEYARKLRSIAHQVGVIIKGFAPDGVVKDRLELTKALYAYAEMITPWAKAVASRMLADIARRDQDMWTQLGNEVNRNLKREIEFSPIGRMMQKALDDQVALITSLPRDASHRVHDLVMLGLSDSTRASEVAREILASGHVTKSRANLIARTEVARTATELTKSRAESAGITHYVWRTSRDQDVRSSHRHMEGKVIAFNQPPEVEPGKFYHAGQFPNCRCYVEPLIPEIEV